MTFATRLITGKIFVRIKSCSNPGLMNLWDQIKNQFLWRHLKDLLSGPG